MRTQKVLISMLFLLAVFNFTGQRTNAQNAQIDVLSPFDQAKAKTEAVKPVQSSVKTSTPEKQEVKEAKINKIDINPLLNPGNPLGLTAAENSINKAYALIKQNKLSEAKVIIEPTADWLTNATEYHTNLYKTLKDVDSAKSQAELERELALKFAVFRDQALYQLALLYIEDKKHQKAVEKLVNVVRSQPRTQLGFNAYQVLQQIGFTYKLQLQQSQEGESVEANNENSD